MKKSLILLFVVLILAGVCLGYLLGKKGCTKNANGTAFTNPTVETLLARRSIRNYTDQPVDRALLEEIARIGVNAPNSRNAQEWEVRIVDNPEYINGITEVYKEVMRRNERTARQVDNPSFKNFFKNGTAVYFIAIPDGPGRYTDLDAGLLAGNICNAAASFGLGTCCLGIQTDFMNDTPEAAPYLRQLKFREDYKLVLCIAVGYPDEAPDAKPRDYSKIQVIE
ncbi:MAG: nitroreductase family protein [Bacteroidales bacterium]|nr:nitroreductase family protein [Bacteroidales bacterium]